MKPKRNYKPGPMDNCYTPYYGANMLVPYLDKDKIIWESAVGMGWLKYRLEDEGFTVLGSDIRYGLDFFNYQPDSWDIQVTNPPYALKYKWIERSLELDKPFALLLPVETLGAITAQRYFKLHKIQIIFPIGRINFYMPEKGYQSSSPFPTAWFCYKLNLPQDMIFAEFERTPDPKEWFLE